MILPSAAFVLHVEHRQRVCVHVYPGLEVGDAREHGRQTHIGAQREAETYHADLSAVVS